MVAASVFPLASLTEMVVGDRFPVVALLPPGRSPHDYEPAPAELKRLHRAVLFLHVGEGTDDWMRRAAVGVTDDPSTVMAVNVNKTNRDPHVWLDLAAMMEFLPRLADRLSSLDPEGAVGYRSRARAAVDSLNAFDAEARHRLSRARNAPFALLHPAFRSFVDRYGLNCVAVLEPHPEGESSPQHLKDVSHSLAGSGARWIFAEPQLRRKGAESMAADTGAKVAMLDPLGGEGVSGRESYLDLLRWNLEQLATRLVPEGDGATPGIPQ